MISDKGNRMDPFTQERFLTIRENTKLTLKQLKENCDKIIEVSENTLDNKREAIKTKIALAVTAIESIDGITTSTLALARALVANFEQASSSNLERFDKGIKNNIPKITKWTHAEYCPGILSAVLEKDWEIIPSTLPNLSMVSVSDLVHTQGRKINNISANLDLTDMKVDRIEKALDKPNPWLLSKVFSDNENVCKIRKKEDHLWDAKPKEALEEEVRKKMDKLSIDHRNMTMEKITPKGRSSPFLKLTLLNQADRKDAMGKLNSIRTATGYIISPVEPREVQHWLANYKKTKRNLIMQSLYELGYDVSNKMSSFNYSGNTPHSDLSGT